MSELTAKLVEVFQLGDEIAGVLDLPRAAWPEPGQYLPAQRHSAEPEVLTISLFRVLGEAERLCVGPLPGNWTPGDTLDLLRPHGYGFQLPSTARRIGLCALGVPPSRLLPLIAPALARGAAVALFCDPQSPAGLLGRVPSMVEVAPISALREGLEWPDFLAVDLLLAGLSRLREIVGNEPLRFEGQALIRTAMPCHGVGQCGVCAASTTKGWQLACVDGPVFPLTEVLHVAG